MQLRERNHSAIILTDSRADSPLQYAVEISYSDPFKTPLGLKVQGQYVKSGTVFVVGVQELDKLIATASASGFRVDENITNLED